MVRWRKIDGVVWMIWDKKEGVLVERSKSVWKLIGMVCRFIMVGYMVIFMGVNGEW